MKTKILIYLFIFGFSILKVIGQDRCNPLCSTTVEFYIGENLFSGINGKDNLYTINFGNGQISNYFKYHSIVSIQYPAPGIYNIILYGVQCNDTLKYAVACVPPPDYSYPILSTIPYCPPRYTECYEIYNPDCNSNCNCHPCPHCYSFEDDLDLDAEENEDDVCWEDSCVTIYPSCVTAEGQISILYGCDNTTRKLVKPLIFVEGIDFGIQDSVNRKYGDFGWPEFITGIDPNVDAPLPIQLMPKLIKKLNADGFDIVLLDFKDGATYIQANALLLVTLINKINKELKEESHSNHEIVVTGASMGGLVAKYALSYMENHYSEGCIPAKFDSTYIPSHNVRLLLTLDSPHNGANIPIGDQLLLYFLRITRDLNSDVDNALKKLDKPATKQLLVYNKSNIKDHVPGPHNLREQLLNDANMNFPKLPRKIGISNGSCRTLPQMDNDGESDILEPYTKEMVHIWREYSLIRVVGRVWATPTYTSELKKIYGARAAFGVPILPNPSVYPGWKKVKNTYNYDGAPGGYRKTNKDIDKGNDKKSCCDVKTKWERHCFIPMVSSIALVQSTPDLNYNIQANLFSGTNHAYIHAPLITPFDAIYAPDENQEHVKITQENIDWIMEEISPANLYRQNETVNKPAVYEARQTITSGKDVDPVKTPSVRTLLGNYTIIPGCGDVTFRAGEKITLKDGFSAKMGSKFHAYIDPMCTVCANANRYVSNDSENSITKIKPIPDKELELYNSFTLIPNPNNGTMQVFYNLQNSSPATFEIYDVTGRKVFSEVLNPTNKSMSISQEQLINGVYMYSVIQNGAVIARDKLVIIK